MKIIFLFYFLTCFFHSFSQNERKSLPLKIDSFIKLKTGTYDELIVMRETGDWKGRSGAILMRSDSADWKLVVVDATLGKYFLCKSKIKLLDTLNKLKNYIFNSLRKSVKDECDEEIISGNPGTRFWIYEKNNTPNSVYTISWSCQKLLNKETRILLYLSSLYEWHLKKQMMLELEEFSLTTICF